MTLPRTSDSQRYTFADLNGNRRAPAGLCPCGRGPKVAQFTMAVREYKDGKMGKQYGSLTRALCESCAVELFLKARDATDA